MILGQVLTNSDSIIWLFTCIDIIDKTLNQARKSRWQKAFAEDSEENRSDAVNRKATIVIEHLIQASDVSHTMQVGRTVIYHIDIF